MSSRYTRRNNIRLINPREVKKHFELLNIELQNTNSLINLKQEELNGLLKTINEKNSEIKNLEAEINKQKDILSENRDEQTKLTNDFKFSNGGWIKPFFCIIMSLLPLVFFCIYKRIFMSSELMESELDSMLFHQYVFALTAIVSICFIFYFSSRLIVSYKKGIGISRMIELYSKLPKETYPQEQIAQKLYTEIAKRINLEKTN